MKLTKNKLKKIYLDKDIVNCELRFNGCWIDNGLSWAHRHKRIFYKGREDLWSFNQTILACINCHMKLEVSRELTKKIFEKLRDPEKT